MTVTQYGYCHKCNERVELVPTTTKALMCRATSGSFTTTTCKQVVRCHKCGSIDIE